VKTLFVSSKFLSQQHLESSHILRTM